MIDSHCHLDLYPHPLAVAKRCEKANVTTLTMTNLPSHFEQSIRHLSGFRRIRVALGLHPLYAERHTAEYSLFEKCLDKTSYVGEVGLDFSREGILTKVQQIQSFEFVLEKVSSKKKILSIHSRSAEAKTLSMLIESQVRAAIFHWYSGPLSLIKEAAAQGYMFSVNPAMIRSERGRSIISHIPRENLLTETDGPFVQVDNKPVEPDGVNQVIKYMSSYWKLSPIEVENTIETNFLKMISLIR